MKQLIYIGGGDCFRSDDDFHAWLQDIEYIPFQEQKRWASWLKESLKGTYEVELPTMPNKFNARYASRKIWFEKIFSYLNDEDTVLIGYSLGGIFLTKYLSENMFPKDIAQLHLVAACFDETDILEEESYLADFIFDPVGLSNMEKQVDKIFLYHSKDDPMVYFSHLQKFKNHLPKANVTVFEDRGHFRQPEFPELLENIKTS